MENHLLEQLAKELEPLAQLWQTQKSTLYVVGGAVRDALLGHELTDVDICSELSLETVQRMLQNSEYTLQVKSVSMGTGVILGGNRPLEYTGFRKENYAQGGRHQPVCVTGGASLLEDAQRRDFTINALYFDIEQHSVIDPLHAGIGDIKRKRLWTTSPNPDTILKDDGMRILRMVRQACQLDLIIPKEMLFSAKKYVHQLEAVSKNTLRGEMEKILLLDGQYEKMTRVKRALLILQGIGALEVLIPPLVQGERFQQNPVYHRYTVLLHNINTCEKMDSVLKLRLAGLLHDVGKPCAWKQHQQMHEHQKIGAQIAENLLREYGFSAKLIKDVKGLINEHMFDLTGKAKRTTVIRKIIALGPEQFDELIQLRRADELGSGILKQSRTAEKWREILDDMKRNGAPFSMRELAISGADIQARFPSVQGQNIRKVLEKLLLICAKKPSQNNEKNLLHHVRHVINDMK